VLRTTWSAKGQRPRRSRISRSEGGHLRFVAVSSSMYNRPTEPTDDQVSAAVTAGWCLQLDEVEYRAVGFGSYHWAARAGVDRFFVTVDDLDEKRRSADDTRGDAFDRLAMALDLARHASDAGLGFVVAPMRCPDGASVRLLGDRFAIAAYPHVDGQCNGWGGYPLDSDRDAVVDLVAQLHRLPVETTTAATDFSLQARDALVDALAGLDSSWDNGPFGEPARQLLTEKAEVIKLRLDQYDRLVAEAEQRPDHRVLTHGEPHSGNAMQTPRGWLLVDWDTAAVAPPERDMWMLDGDSDSLAARYNDLTGIALVPELIELYSLTWDLADLGLALRGFRQHHGNTEDDINRWQGLVEYVATL
jgi:hypothetical protein